jgi:hypothetical protein
MSEWYVLDGRDVRPVADYTEYFRWRDVLRTEGPTASLRIAVDDVNDVHVSTVFLGLDHQWGDGPPLVFETMTFDHRAEKICDEWQWRYSTLDDAEAGHRAIVAAIREGKAPPEDVGS